MPNTYVMQGLTRDQMMEVLRRKAEVLGLGLNEPLAQDWLNKLEDGAVQEVPKELFYAPH